MSGRYQTRSTTQNPDRGQALLGESPVGLPVNEEKDTQDFPNVGLQAATDPAVSNVSEKLADSCSSVGHFSKSHSSRLGYARSSTTSRTGTSLSSTSKARLDMRIAEINLEKSKREKALTVKATERAIAIANAKVAAEQAAEANMLDSELAVIHAETELAKAKVMAEAHEGLLDLEVDNEVEPALSAHDKVNYYVESLVQQNTEVPGPSKTIDCPSPTGMASDAQVSGVGTADVPRSCTQSVATEGITRHVQEFFPLTAPCSETLFGHPARPSSSHVTSHSQVSGPISPPLPGIFHEPTQASLPQGPASSGNSISPQTPGSHVPIPQVSIVKSHLPNMTDAFDHATIAHGPSGCANMPGPSVPVTATSSQWMLKKPAVQVSNSSCSQYCSTEYPGSLVLNPLGVSVKNVTEHRLVATRSRGAVSHFIAASHGRATMVPSQHVPCQVSSCYGPAPLSTVSHSWVSGSQASVVAGPLGPISHVNASALNGTGMAAQIPVTSSYQFTSFGAISQLPDAPGPSSVVPPPDLGLHPNVQTTAPQSSIGTLHKLPQPTTTVHQFESGKSSDLKEFAQILVRCQGSRPLAEGQQFDGGPLKYYLFIRQVQDRILRIHAQSDPSHALQLLLDSTAGQARKLINYCIMLPADKALQEALNLLYKAFGLPAVSIKAHLKLVCDGPQLRTDEKSLRDF